MDNLLILCLIWSTFFDRMENSTVINAKIYRAESVILIHAKIYACLTKMIFDKLYFFSG